MSRLHQVTISASRMSAAIRRTRTTCGRSFGVVILIHRASSPPLMFKLVAAHLRSLRPHRPTTIAEHMPSSHRRYRDWTHERIQREAAAIGDDTAALVEIILRSRPHPEQGFRSCIGILRLAQRYDAERLDGACARALALGTRSYSSVAAILKSAREDKPADPEQPSLMHENIRGSDYYN